MDEKTPQERFDRCLSLIEKGYICFEEEANKLADVPFAVEKVQDALYTGAASLYRDYLSLISEGQVDYEETARSLADRFCFPLRPLHFALKDGIRMSEKPAIVR